jgi:hypothetical protein
VAIAVQKEKVHIYVPSEAEYKITKAPHLPPPNSPILSKSQWQQSCTLMNLKKVVCMGLKGKYWEALLLEERGDLNIKKGKGRIIYYRNYSSLYQ